MNKINVMLILFQHLNRFRNTFGMTLFFVLFSFFVSPAVSMEIKSLVPMEGMKWTLETTEGFLNIENSLMSSADGNESYSNLVLNSKGILFHSFYDNVLLTSAQLNLGFVKKVDFLWTERPDIAHEIDINSNLRAIELDVQKLFPILQSHWLTVSLFGAYSYFEFSIEDSKNSVFGDSFVYNSFSGGIQGTLSMSKKFTQHGYVSYSPLVFYGHRRDDAQFLNYGVEFRTDTHPVSFTLFCNAKHAFRQKGRTWFKGFNRSVDSNEVGFSFHWNFRERTQIAI